MLNRKFLSVVSTSVVISVFLTALLAGVAYKNQKLIFDHCLWCSQEFNSSMIGSTLPSQNPSQIPDVVDKTIPAVVSVVISADVPILERYYDSFNPFGSFFGQNINIPRQRQIGTEKQEIGGGTGFFVSSDGYLVTNKHVVDTANAEYSIVTNDGTSYPVHVVAKDPTFDIAILKVDSSDNQFPYLSFATGDIRLGEGVIAIGNALAEFPNSVSVGVVSGLSRNIVAGDVMGGSSESLEGLIQTDAAINHGNSGGPLLNLSGEVVGVSVAIADGSENIGFALSGQTVASVYKSVLENGKIIRPFLGVRFLQIDKTFAKKNNLTVDYGVIVLRGETMADLAVLPGSPADKAGLKENDIILEINNIKLDGQKSLPGMLRDFAPNETIKLKILRAGEEKIISVTLTPSPDDLF